MQKRSYGSGSLIERNGVYYGKWRSDGKQVMQRLGKVREPATKDGLTRTQAEARLRAEMAKVAPPAPAERLTITEASERLLQHLEAMGRKPSTLRGYRYILKRIKAQPIGKMPVSKVQRRDVESFREQLMAGLQPKTVRSSLGFLHSVLSYSVRREWAHMNPCDGLDLPRSLEDESAIRFLDPDEIERLLAAVPVDTLTGRLQRAIYMTAIFTGMRQGELVALRWQDVDFAAQRVRVNRNFVRGSFGTPKGGRGRSIPLADRLGIELHGLHRETEFSDAEDLVFANPTTGRPLNGNGVYKAFKRHLRRAGIAESFRFHDLRHTFGTRAAAAGVAMRTVQEWMGHRDFRTTLIYADYAPSAHEVEQINAVFAATNPSTILNATQANSDQHGSRKALQIR